MVVSRPTPKAADGVRGCVSNHALHGQDDEAVPPRERYGAGSSPNLVGELASRNHLVQMLAGVDAFRDSYRPLDSRVAILVARPSQGLAIVPNRRVHVADVALPTVLSRGAEHHAGEHGGVNSRCMSSGMTFHHVFRPQRHNGGWTALLSHHVFAIAILYQQQQIGKAQIGDHLPIGDKMMQPLAVLVVEVGARCRICEKSAISLSYADAPPPSRQATQASTTTMTTSHLQYRANRVARLPARGQRCRHVAYRTRQASRTGLISKPPPYCRHCCVHGTHHRVCLRFGVVIAIVPGRKIDRQIEIGSHELLPDCDVVAMVASSEVGGCSIDDHGGDGHIGGRV